jgi:hypothetical protein
MSAIASLDQEGTERRAAPRLGAAGEHGIVSARVRGGDAASVLNLSVGGALVETSCRLLPGSTIELHVTTNEGRTAVRGRVVRCVVSALGASAICYRGAIRFDASLPWTLPAEGNHGYSVHMPRAHAPASGGAAATPAVL